MKKHVIINDVHLTVKYNHHECDGDGLDTPTTGSYNEFVAIYSGDTDITTIVSDEVLIEAERIINEQ